MKTSRKLLRIWLTISSFIGFVVGWIFISRSTEVQSVTHIGNTAVEMPALQALPTLQSGTSNSALNNVQTFTVTTNTSSSSVLVPQMRTGGS